METYSQGYISAFKVLPCSYEFPVLKKNDFFMFWQIGKCFTWESLGVKICFGLKPCVPINASSVVNKECDILRANRFTKFFPMNFDSENPQVRTAFSKVSLSRLFHKMVIQHNYLGKIEELLPEKSVGSLLSNSQPTSGQQSADKWQLLVNKRPTVSWQFSQCFCCWTTDGRQIFG